MTFWIIVVLLAFTPLHVERLWALCRESHPRAGILIQPAEAVRGGERMRAIEVQCYLAEPGPMNGSGP